MIKEYPMRVVSKITGLSADQIRKWEERYPILKINRSRKGSRRFTDRDLEILQLMNEAKSIGFTLQEIGTLKLIDLRNLVGEIRSGEKKIEYPEIEKLNNLKSVYKFFGLAKKNSTKVCEAKFSAMITKKSSSEIF